MSIIYGCVAVRVSDRSLLCQVDSPDPKAAGKVIPSTWMDVVSKCGSANFRTSYFIDSTSETDRIDDPNCGGSTRSSVFLLANETLAIGVIGQETIQRRNGAGCCEELLALFEKMFVEKPSSLTSLVCEPFKKPAGDILVKASRPDYTTDQKVAKVKKAVDEAKDLALDNVERVLQRGEHIDDIVTRSEELTEAAQGFHTQSRALKNQLWWNSTKGILLIVCIVILFLTGVYFVFTAGGEDKHHKKSDNATPAPTSA